MLCLHDERSGIRFTTEQYTYTRKQACIYDMLGSMRVNVYNRTAYNAATGSVVIPSQLVVGVLVGVLNLTRRRECARHAVTDTKSHDPYTRGR